MSQLRTIGIVGVGQMGCGIAQVCAMAGYKTRIWDADSAALSKALPFIRAHLGKMVEKQKLGQAEADKALGLLGEARSIGEFSDCDLVIEAIIENFEIKAKLFKELDQILQPHALLGSNTSSISITRLAAATKRPENFIGIHFMNPVPVMKLVEIIRGLQTSDQAYQTVTEYVSQIGKTAVLAIDGPGFIVNRILVPMINEAIFLVQEGVKPEDIDNAMKLGTNQPMGPLTLADFVGLDTLLYICQILQRELGEDKYRPCPLLVKYVEAGWYGKKSGRGFYKY
ncbi:MAG: 3-hydroxybutyryl-CoA dehydrogenase [Proteobacteria bacterium]|nr:MAG: 3-hydroxybutyryl-CoA dehydrogenase [Pseudomonadota bacterium]